MYKRTYLYLTLSLFSIALSAQSGLRAEYYNGHNFDAYVLTRTDADVNFDWNYVAPAPEVIPTDFSVRWTGRLLAPKSGSYYFSAKVDDGIRLWVGNKLVIDAWDLHDSENFSGTTTLAGGQYYDLKIEYFNALNEGEIHLKWQLPGEEPFFRGALGYNDKKIDPKFFSSSDNTQVQEKPVVANPKPVKKEPKPKPIETKPSPPKPEPQKNTTVSRDTIEKYTPKNIMFVQSKSAMLPGSFAELDNLASMLQRYPNLKLNIEGHTDNIGDAQKNLKLSEERAQVVALYLIRHGVAESRIQAKGYGGSRPLTDDDSPEGHAKNRRVAFIIR